MLLKAPFVLAVVVLCPSVLVSVVVLLHRDSLLRCWTVYGHSNNLWENWVVGAQFIELTFERRQVNQRWRYITVTLGT